MRKFCCKLLFPLFLCCCLIPAQAQSIATAAPATPNFWPQWALNAQHSEFLSNTVGQPLNQNLVNLVYDFNVDAEKADPNAGGGLNLHYQVPLVDGNDVFAVREVVGAAVQRARQGAGPSLIEAVTYRHLAHNEGEEVFSGVYRPPEEVANWKARDPVIALRRRLESTPEIALDELDALEQRERERIERAVEAAEASAFPAPEEALEDLFAERVS